ncbi:separase KNAG_0B01060 [Huiozyma naganishii CBS 8797]|uniref:separase n=1 Tax=Huiozyma naganishii (strain ATCC MYA-139 / BCRC 22969 / CBS 8797 / KCTC 17520 / NBRC 10181 / NCYC 3082 / Yp74L-3) TaxID=1071383 RepID=J7RG90_HUIN7|nr:hypothetical protein KNAG_0B01060 [Kazachstania naganishii CBS 8797]CCK68553.1 hypothetical protein KNAG_0B01060 [Kazachstania naganishii CBS 8797]
MANTEEPLNEVVINKTTYARPTEKIEKTLSTLGKENINHTFVSLEERFQETENAVSSFLKKNADQLIPYDVDPLHNSLLSCYFHLRSIHAIGQVKLLVKKHLSIIGKLLTAKVQKDMLIRASEEIISLYNENNMDKKSKLDDVLQSDFKLGNIYYLSTLKILTLQLIIKYNLVDEYKETILELFLHDDRYFFKDPKLKINLLIKLLLNFFAKLDDCKTLFGLKFLQYLKQFDIDFSTYIKNISKEVFEKKLISSSHKVNRDSCYFYYIRSYFYQFQKQVTQLNTITIQSLLYEDSDSSIKDSDSLVKSIDFPKKEYSYTTSQVSEKPKLTESSVYFSGTTISHLRQKIKITLCLWNSLNLDSQTITKGLTNIFDETLIWLNTNLRSLEEYKEDLFSTFTALKEFCYFNHEVKRLRNLINVSFNGYVVFKDFEFLRVATAMMIELYLVEHTQELRSSIIVMISKFIESARDKAQKSELFLQLYNFFVTINIEDISELVTFCQQICSQCLKSCEPQFPQILRSCSEIQTAILLTHLPISRQTTCIMSQWTSVTFNLYQLLSQNTSIPAPSTVSTVRSPRFHYLYNYEVLLKVSFFLNQEMTQHSSSNLPQILQTYEKKWLRRSITADTTISLLEIKFTKILLQYLNFCAFHKSVISLVEMFKENERYYRPVMLVSEKYVLEAFVNLQMVEKIATFEKQYTLFSEVTLRDASTTDVIDFLHIQLLLFFWNNDPESFTNLFHLTIPKTRPEILDVKNSARLGVSDYVNVLLLNVQVHLSASRLNLISDNVIAAVTEAKKALKLASSLLKKMFKLSPSSRLCVIRLLSETYSVLSDAYISIGIAREPEFYMKELSRVICELREPTWVFRSLYSLFEYYDLTVQFHLKGVTLQKLNKTFDYLQGAYDIHSLTVYLYSNGEITKITQSLELYFQFTDIGTTFLPSYWNLKCGSVVDDLKCLPCYRPLNIVNKMRRLLRQVLKLTEHNAFLKEFFKSSLAIPSIKPKHIDLPTYGSTTESPRSSNMTPRTKSLQQKFERSVIVQKLQRMKKYIEQVNIHTLRHAEQHTVSNIYLSTILLLSNIEADSTFLKDDLRQSFFLSDLSRYVPFYYDRIMSCLDKDIYNEMSILPFGYMAKQIANERAKALSMQQELDKELLDFNVISIDICPLTENLVLTKYEGQSHRRTTLRISLKENRSKDTHCGHLSFSAALEEMNTIVEENNKTTSTEVTTQITTPEGRKKWWQSRYQLDKRLEQLLEKICNFWINGFAGYFSPHLIDQSHFAEFKSGFYEVLHQTLPSRKNFATPSAFIEIEDWILEIFLKLDPENDNYINMIEDLLYFVFDILLFHGEENAYDEIDLGQCYVQLVDKIKKYQSHVCNTTTYLKNQVSHTFLIVSSLCHIFPWESIPFLKDMRISRLPSYRSLVHLLEKKGASFPINISLDTKLGMILNPNGDLPRTELNFKDTFRHLYESTSDSKLVSGGKPSKEEYLAMIRDSNFFVYVGHGSGEQYASLQEVKKSESLAASLLLGCSSAEMKRCGKLESTNSVYSYLLGGSPLVLGNLWDVTDKDIDKFSQSVFEKIGLIKDFQGEISGYKDIPDAVAESRDVCHLKYLNGAAPVIYGLPAKFT